MVLMSLKGRHEAGSVTLRKLQTGLNCCYQTELLLLEQRKQRPAACCQELTADREPRCPWPPRLRQRPLLAEPGMAAASKGGMWFAGSWPQPHKTKCGKLDLKRSGSSFTRGMQRVLC